MFCPLEQIELSVGTCPISKCIYRDLEGACLHDTLESEQVEAKVIAGIRSIKVYSVRAQIQEARERITIGAILIRYSEYIKDSWPEYGNSYLPPIETVNTSIVKTDTAEEGTSTTASILAIVFGLTERQQQKFLSQARITEWAKRQALTLDLSKVREILRSIPPQALKEV